MYVQTITSEEVSPHTISRKRLSDSICQEKFFRPSLGSFNNNRRNSFNLYTLPRETPTSKSILEERRRFRKLRGLFRSFYGRVRNRSESGGNNRPYYKRGRSASLPHPMAQCSNNVHPSPTPSRHRLQSDVKSIDGTTEQNSDANVHQPASVESLVRKCASCFDNDGECVDSQFPRVLFLTHAWFMTSEQLVVLFTKLYEDENTSTELKKKVLYAIRYWMKTFPRAFDVDAPLAEAIKDLQTSIETDDQVDSSIIDLSNRGDCRWMRSDRLSIRPTPGAERKRRKVSLVFHHLEAEELAIHMSYLEFKSFKRLGFEDFHKYATRGTIKNNAKLERAVFLFNNITFWTQCMVIGQHTPQERAAVITKYIKIAQKLREMRNFNTLMAVVGGLTHTAIARLKKTMSALPKESIKALDELVELLDSKSNYIAYRRESAQQHDGFQIPIIGIHMKDIIALHTALPDRVGDSLINVKKMMTIGSTYSEMLDLQKTPFPYDVNKDLVNTLRVSLYLYYTEQEIYALSLKREPRDTRSSISSTSSPSKMNSIVFAEFTKFTCQLDNDTVKQHVTAMVESVFKAYDHDNDGFISEEEFNSFTDNFPMMESFSAMDVDRDGRISRSEMCDYFMKASAVRRNDFCQNFTHEFVETTYFHPTFCQECDKLLWGLVKQGWKCKGCSINCHKHCKDTIVQECRPKQSTNNQGNGQSTKRSGGREKNSVSSESDISANGDSVTSIIVSVPPTPSSVLDDEAFDSPGELANSGVFFSSPSLMRRSTSLASADVASRSGLRQRMNSKTPPPSRKATSSPSTESNGGKRSIQRTMQKMLPKRNNSQKTRNMADASTQTTVASPKTPQTPRTATEQRLFLYPSVTRTQKVDSNSKLPNGRLGSAGEELEEIPFTQTNNNHTRDRVTSQEMRHVTKNFNNIKIEGISNRRKFPIEPLDISSPFDDHSTNQVVQASQNNCARWTAIRRDSGLSDCSTFAPSERSSIVTPTSLSQFRYENGNLNSSTTKESQKITCNENSETKGKHDIEFALRKENERLQQTNTILQSQLNETKNYIKLLQQNLKDRHITVPAAANL